MTAIRNSLLLVLVPALWACEHRPSPDLPRGTDAYRIAQPAPQDSVAREQLISTLDLVDITVFQEPDLSFDDLMVSADGTIPFPFLGRVQAAGRTAPQLAEDLRARLDGPYLLNPQVTVLVADSVEQKVAVEGLVNEPGVYEVRGATTLLTVLARAKSPTETAALDEVVVFRFVDGQRTGAVFDIDRIRSGHAPDPEILGGDTVVVGFSEVRAGVRLLLQTIPAFGIFRPY